MIHRQRNSFINKPTLALSFLHFYTKEETHTQICLSMCVVSLSSYLSVCLSVCPLSVCLRGKPTLCSPPQRAAQAFLSVPTGGGKQRETNTNS